MSGPGGKRLEKNFKHYLIFFVGRKGYFDSVSQYGFDLVFNQYFLAHV